MGRGGDATVPSFDQGCGHGHGGAASDGHALVYGHGHGHSHGEMHGHRFLCMTFFTGSFMLVELIVGLAIGSLALVADAMHMMSDLLALIIGWYCANLSARGATEKMTFGYGRAKHVGGLMNGSFLFTTSLFIVMDALHRFFEGPSTELANNVDLLLIVACLGLAINAVGLFIFGGHSHGHTEHNLSSNESHGHGHSQGGHSHGHDHDHSTQDSATIELEGGGEESDRRVTVLQQGSDDVNEKGVFLHIMGDFLGSIGVIFVALIIKFTDWTWKLYLDPAVSVVIAAFILCNAFPLIKASASTLMNMSHIQPGDFELLKRQLNDIVHSKNAIHELHVWNLVDDINIATMHVSLPATEKEKFSQYLSEIKLLLHTIGIHSSCVQPEFRSAEEHESASHGCLDPCASNDLCSGMNCCKETTSLLHDDREGQHLHHRHNRA